MFIRTFFKKSIKKIVAKANVTIAFFKHLHIFMIKDDKNVGKIMYNTKKFLFD